ncbi:hypothetical protein EW145_g5114 [Phellinidium pouzarii]|uniref:DUF4336 domain-containing protein n=1 Tax=Phellinidium pouzarii TaxID=167371 RepID=A0A4S4L173_9AGAM|nr:hypothetical protein EW145_g5114 [Phellinidium pouzarii]
MQPTHGLSLQLQHKPSSIIAQLKNLVAMSETVIREVTTNVWTFSRPFSRFGFIPIGGRSTVVKLANGGLWVLASTPLDEQTKLKLEELGGRVKYIVGANAVHSLFMPEFKQAYPDAKLIGLLDHLSKPHLKAHKFDGVYGRDPEGTKHGFEEEIKTCYFSGFQNKDIAFNHVASRTLIEADLLFNLPPREQYSKSKSSPNFPPLSGLNPFSWAHKQLVWSSGKDKEASKRDAETVASWDFDRIIPCHGDIIESGGKKAWMEAYKWYIEKK